MPEGPAYTADQVRAAERPLLEAGEPLMAHAASALSTIVARELPAGGTLLVLAGRGDNGGDALLAAAALAAEGVRVDALLTGESGHDLGVRRARAAGVTFVGLDEASESVEIGGYDIVLDGIVGIGASGSGALRGGARDAVAAILPFAWDKSVTVIAVDLPSGLHPDEGTVADEFVLPAAVTVTFGAVKAGLVRGRGPELAGRIVLVELGLDLTDAAPAASGVVEIYRA